MDKNLIYSVNPLIISKIRYDRGRRRGKHSLYWKLLKKRNPIRNALGIYNDDYHTWNHWENASVVICGANGREIREISCKSNYEAINLRDQLIDKLDEFLSKLVVDTKPDSV